MTTRRLSAKQAQVIGDALFAMAKADGNVDGRELAVIEDFLAECAGRDGAFGVEGEARVDLRGATAGLEDAFLSACIHLSLADGDFTADEAVLLRGYASEIDVTDERLDDLVRMAESEQALPLSAPPVDTLVDVLKGWSRQHRPTLRLKVQRFLDRATA